MRNTSLNFLKVADPRATVVLDFPAGTAHLSAVTSRDCAIRLAPANGAELGVIISRHIFLKFRWLQLRMGKGEKPKPHRAVY